MFLSFRMNFFVPVKRKEWTDGETVEHEFNYEAVLKTSVSKTGFRAVQKKRDKDETAPTRR